MSNERQSPDALIDQTNLIGSLSDIQDDPDSPDGNWLTAIATNAASICLVDFPTPSGNPTQGADLQEFRALVRKMGGTGTPTARIELFENGNLIDVGADVDITSTDGVVLSFTWDANLLDPLGNVDGSLVQCRVYGTFVGGKPSARATIEVGAVKWNCEYSEGEPPPPITGTATQGQPLQSQGSSGLLKFFGGATQRQQVQAQVGQGSLLFSGVAGQGQKPQSQNAVGNVEVSGFTGIATQTQELQSQNGSGKLEFLGTAAQSQTAQEQAATAVLRFAGAANQEQGLQAQNASAKLRSLGAVTQGQAFQAQAGIGEITIGGNPVDLPWAAHCDVDFSEWDAYGVNGGVLAIDPVAAYRGAGGTKWTLAGAVSSAYMRKNDFARTDLHFGMWIFVPSSFVIGEADNFWMGSFGWRDAAGGVTHKFNRAFYRDGGGVQLRDYYYTDTGGDYTNSADLTPDKWHWVETHLKAATAPGANDGIYKRWVDKVLVDEQLALDSDELDWDDFQINCAEVDEGTSGYYYIDEVKVSDKYIGPGGLPPFWWWD